LEDYVVNSHLLLKAREDYWGQVPSVKSLQYKVINEDSQIVNALETGDVDVAPVPMSEVDYVESLGYDVEVYNSGMNYAAWYSMLPGSPLETKEARWAVSYAINRQSISDILSDGRAGLSEYPASHGLTDVESRFFNMHETYSVGHDIERAKALAEQSGLVGKTLRIITNGAAAYNTLAEIIQGDLLEIGVNSEIVPYDQATFFSVMMDASNFEIALFTPSAPSMMAVDIMSMYLTFIPLGWTGPDRDRYGELSMGALATFDPASRSDQFYEALKIFVDYDPWYGLCEMVSARTNASDLRGMDYMISGNVYYQYVSFAD
jgi:ABC-type transport system substrate-binding protein